MNRFRLLIGDDHPLILEGVRRILEENYNVVGAVGDGRSLVEEALRLRPDVVLMDIAMPSLNGIEAARQIREMLPTTKVIFVTQHQDRQYIQAAFRLGASGYVMKQSAAAELVIALEEVAAGRFYVSEALRKNLPEVLVRQRDNPGDLFGGSLTPRQLEVLQLVAEGKSAKEIAEELKISPKTVEFHKASIMEELGMRTTAELTRYAISNGIARV